MFDCKGLAIILNFILLLMLGISRTKMFEASKFACTTVEFYRSIHNTTTQRSKDENITSTMIQEIHNAKPETTTPHMTKKATPNPKSKPS